MSRFQSRLTPKAVPASSTSNNNVPSKAGNIENNVEAGAVTRPREPQKECICNRAKQLVMCQNCGFTIDGRARLQCPSHPSITYLNDLVACPRCKSGTESLREFPKPIQTPRVVARKIQNKRRCEMMECEDMDS